MDVAKVLTLMLEKLEPEGMVKVTEGTIEGEVFSEAAF
jgi:hypothetical protein